MIDAASIREIMSVYAKYGWVLRRILLSEPLRSSIADIAGTFGEVPVLRSDLDAAWFSRPPNGGPVAWEIRHLSTSPYALLEHIDEGSPSVEDDLAIVENRLRSSLSDKRSGH